ncbi:MAG: ATP-dependent Clp protease adaptor ClpS [Planctomycetes bacterium]|nr:ATP-dependent Clp protease adaptor ClpS [Planctomycetota bacterium]
MHAAVADAETAEETSEETRTRHTPMWKVLFHNDDVTPMDFVTAVLVRWFGHDLQAAQRIMLTVHHTGIGLAGVYPLELAELKRDQVVSAARPHYPLRVTLEPA